MSERPTSLAERVPTLPPPDFELQSQNTNFLAAIVRRWPLILLGIILGMIGGFTWYLTSDPVFESRAQVLIIKRDIGLLVESSRLSYVEDYVSTQQTLIRAKKVMRAAAEKIREVRLNRDLPADINVRTEALIAGTTVSRDRDATTGVVGSNILNLGFRGADPIDTKRILECIITAYQEELKTVYDERTEQEIRLINKLIDTNQQQLKVVEEKNKKIQQDLSKITNENIDELSKRLSLRTAKLDIEKDNLFVITNSIKQMLEAKADPTVRRDIMLTILGDLRGVQGFTFQLDDSVPIGTPEMQRKQLQLLIEKESQRYGENHQRMKELRAQLRALDVMLGKNVDKPSEDVDAVSKWDALLTKLQNQEKIKKIQIDQLKGELEDITKTFREASTIIIDLKSTQSLKERLERDLQMSDEKKSKLEATRNQGGYQASPISEPSDGGKIAPRLMQSLLMFSFLGVLAGFGLALAFEFTDKSFRTPAEIRRRLGLPVVGHIPPIRVDLETDNPALKGKNVEIESTIVTHLRPKSIEAEAYRGVRTQLYFSTQGAGHQVIQVTSPNPSDGKSTLAANLAVSIAQSGKKVILVDCDFRKPRVHKIFHLEKPDVGLASAIIGDCDLGSAIRTSEIENLSLLPCGPRPQNPAELLTSPEFQTMLDKLREMFDFVIVDTPPVLAVSDPAVVAPRVDGVLLVFRMTKKARPTAERAREQLAALGANVLGVVVNGTGGSKDEGYGYGYGYNYGYGYQYQYQYEYEYADNYTDDNVDSPSSYGNMKRPELPPARS